ncbi:MAG: hypothetical protein ACRDS9_14405 [Pseudonocardiaceae bacterium]
MTIIRPSHDGELRTSQLVGYGFEHAERWPDKSAVTDGVTTVTHTRREQTATARRVAAPTTKVDADDVHIEVRRADRADKLQIFTLHAARCVNHAEAPLTQRLEPVNGIVVR